MRISDWSSDVCSSDLHDRRREPMTLSLAAARDALSRGLFADTARPKKPQSHFGLDMLSDWLPYRVSDAGAKLYRTARSKGFGLDVTDRKSCGEGKSVVLRFDLGGRSTLKKTK